MAEISLEPLRSIKGYMAAAVIECDSGLSLVEDGGGLDLGIAAAGNADMIKTQRRIIEALQLNDTFDDILINLTKQYHLIRPLETNQSLFMYVVLDRDKANLAMARHELRRFEKTLDMG